MRTRYEIEITQEIIEEARTCHAGKCMVAEAIRRQIPGADIITADTQFIRFSLPADRERLFYATPMIAQHYMVKFDAGDKDIPPFKFRIQHPAYRVPMRPRTAPGTPRPDNSRKGERVLQLAIQTENGFKGKTVIQKDVSLPRNFRVRAAPYQRRFGARAMRINQANPA